MELGLMEDDDVGGFAQDRLRHGAHWSGLALGGMANGIAERVCRKLETSLVRFCPCLHHNFRHLHYSDNMRWITRIKSVSLY